MFERSRAAVSTPGCRPNQTTRLSCERSGRRSATLWRSRSTRIVPYRAPRRNAKSSTPSTLTFPASSGAARLARESRASRPTEPQLEGQPGARPAAQLRDDRQQRRFQPVRLAGVGRHLRQPLAEDATLAGGLVAEEAAHLGAEDDGGAMPRQVGDLAGVAAVAPARRTAAHRALCRAGDRSDGDVHAPSTDG